jgi:uncharacterized protein (TIGR02145 family)
VVLLVAISCKKESSIQSSSISDESSMQHDITHMNASYASVTIGTQVWMKNNLNVSRYRNGDRIPQIKDSAKWANLTTGAWCWYNNDSANGRIYGRLYNWYAVHDPRGLAPAGWHIPSDTEWTTLSTYLGDNAGGKLKETGTIEAGTGLWYAPNKGATNESGFTGLPGGHRLSSGSFFHIGNYGNWWSSTQVDTTNAWNRTLTYLNGNVGRSYHYLQSGFSVRCLKD